MEGESRQKHRNQQHQDHQQIWIVSAEEGGQKLVSFLQKQLGGSLSLRAIKKQIEQGSCLVNGRAEMFASVVVWEKDEVILRLPQTDLPHRILWEDEDLLVFDKPPHLLSEPQGLVAHLASYCSRLILVHRLDRETTGVILLAKKPSIQEELVRQFRHFLVKKSYLALVQGVVDRDGGVIEGYLQPSRPSSLGPVWEETKNPNGLYAFTAWKRLEKSQMATYLRCYPKTGRTHQIRVHLAGMGHPIIGDRRYGCLEAKYSWASRFFLHAECLEFIHPITQRPISVRAPVPEDFRQAMDRLGICRAS